ncbi:MAG: cupin domain-containing protein [Armatimonadota bacterium]|nr:cupin domain-containing protein [Armatimonadota bacterium]MDR7520038.1 cupin domain-containing protein [Armatimonadota bacterium]MDR7550648.1 cupin domain-containing protein [Armatimonadota bacterium]
MHYVARIDEVTTGTPDLYEGHAAGFRRATYVDHAVGSVHMGTGICFLEPGGLIRPHLHSFEETFYVLEGTATVQIGDRAYALGPGHFGLIRTGVRHAWRNVGAQPVRWLESQAPQPRPTGRGRDTFFVGDDVTVEARPPDPHDPADRFLGHFDESRLPQPGGPSEMEGFNPVTGVTVKMLVDRTFGAVHQSLFIIQYQPGAKIDPHDHTFEESYFIVGGEVEATADGRVYRLGPGSVIWTSVGCIHSFANVGGAPARWIETQAPLPPAAEAFRFERDWARYVAGPA